jgi:5-methylcytosine-specific restriction enzyme subunit McrC
MRTIRLTEHRRQAEALSPSELRQLLAVAPGLLEVAARPDGRFDLKPRSRVGTVVAGPLQVLIRPKVGLRNVLFLLAYASGVRWGAEDFPYEEEDDLLRAMAWWFDRASARAARFGLVRDYVDREETLTTLRGRLAIERQLAARPGRRIPIECRYQDYSEDTALNQVVKAAHIAILRVPNLDQDVAVRLRHRARQVFGDVTSAEYGAGTLPPLRLSRLNRHWEAPARLARMILRQRSLRDEHGHVLGVSFTVDMNVLFERFVQAVVAERVRASAYTLEPQARRRLTYPAALGTDVVVPAITMRPDLLLSAGSAPVAVADAKYKELLRIGDWEHPDIYQLIAYCVRLGLRRGLLIYASARPLTESTVVDAGLTVATIGLDLNGEPGVILSRARRAADALLAQADQATLSAAAA